MSPFEAEVLHCRDCRVYEDKHHEQHCRRLGIPPDAEIMVWTMKNGMTLGLGGDLGSVPLWSDYVLCAKHEAEAPTRYLEVPQ